MKQVIQKTFSGLLLLTLFLAPQMVQAQTGRIAGTTVDSLSGTPIPGVNVVIAQGETLIGTSSDANGNYEIANISPGTYNVQASFVGYTTRMYSNVVVQAGQTTNLDVRLAEDLLQLDEVIATAYGATARQSVTGSVASVNMETIESLPIASVDEALEGQVPGVLVQNRSGIPGGGPSIQVRGTGNVGGGWSTAVRY